MVTEYQSFDCFNRKMIVNDTKKQNFKNLRRPAPAG